MFDTTQVSVIRRKYRAVRAVLDERQRRLWAAAEVQALGRGGLAAVVRATGLARTTVWRGVQEYGAGGSLASDRIRRPGGGRKRATVLDPGLSRALKKLIEPVTRGDPQRALRWTCKSTRRLSAELAAQGYSASRTLVANLLAEQGYRLQGNRKTKEGTHHPDRNAQFEHINRRVRRQLVTRQPAISVDTKKKELIGDFKNAGRIWRPRGGRKKFASMTSWTRRRARRFRMGYTTWDETPDGSAWAWIMTPRPSRCIRSAVGGGRWGVASIRKPTRC